MTTSDRMVKPSPSGVCLLVVGIAAVASIPYALIISSVERCGAIATTLASVGATILGFVLTAVTILAALAKSALVENMYRTGHAKVLLDELFGAVIVYLLVTACSIVCIVGPEVWSHAAVILAASYFVLGIAVLTFAGHKFYSVMIALGPTRSAA